MALSSEKGRRWLTRAYSWGAAVVIVGALFKILHLPHANLILGVSLSFEALVFILSGFELPMSDYHWEDVFPVLKSKNPMDRPDFSVAGAMPVEGMTVGGEQHVGGAIIMGGATPVGDGRPYQGAQSASAPPTPQARVQSGMAAMGLNLSEEDTEALALSIQKLNSAAEQISKMADLTEVTRSYIDRMSSVSQNLEKFNEMTGSLGEVTDSLVSSCKAITGQSEADADEKPQSYVENMSKLNENLAGLNHFYETQLTGIRSQMDTILHINAGLNRIRDLYDSSIVDSATFRNENERMAQLLAQLNQVYSRLLQAMTVNVQSAGYPPQQPPYQPPYQGGYR
jgi:gliding motility-associated protein GldL